MDKKSLLKDMSAAELRQELIDRLRDQIRRNEEENERLRDQIRQLNPQVVVVTSNVRMRGRPVTKLARNDMSLRDVIVQVLRNAPEPLRIKDVAELVRNAGYMSKAGNFQQMVSISLSQNDELFEKVSRGVYRLRHDAAADEAEATGHNGASVNEQPEFHPEPLTALN